jgi:hypothetical protein
MDTGMARSSVLNTAVAIVALTGVGIFYLHRAQHDGAVRFVDMQVDQIRKSFAPLDDDMRQLGSGLIITARI